ncbi:hypothetical protein CR513_53116, partial [Mucuna pruriens]
MYGSDKNQDTSHDIFYTHSFSTHMPTLNEKNEVDDVHTTCHNHIKGDTSTKYKSLVAFLSPSK